MSGGLGGNPGVWCTPLGAAVGRTNPAGGPEGAGVPEFTVLFRTSVDLQKQMNWNKVKGTLGYIHRCV